MLRWRYIVIAQHNSNLSLMGLTLRRLSHRVGHMWGNTYPGPVNVILCAKPKACSRGQRTNLVGVSLMSM